MLESLREDQNPKMESLISNLTNILNGLLQGENNNRKAILDAINSLKKKEINKKIWGGLYVKNKCLTLYDS